jgi:hypothetical protein
MQKQQSSKLILGLLAMTIAFSVVATVLLNYAYADGSSKQIQTPEEKAKKEIQSALKETRKEAQQTTIQTREKTAQHEKLVKADKEKQLVQEPIIAPLMIKSLDGQRAKFELRQFSISKTVMQKKELAADSARFKAVEKQSHASELKAEKLKGYTQSALKETRKQQQDITINTRNSNIIKHMDWKNTSQNKIKKTVFLPLQLNQYYFFLGSIQNIIADISHKTQEVKII